MAPADSPIQTLINGYLITCYRRLNQTDKIEALAANSDSIDARFNQAEAYARQGKYKEAMQIYQELLKEDKQLTPEGRQIIFQRVLAIEIEVERAKPADQRDWTRVDQLAKALAKELKLRDAASLNLKSSCSSAKTKPARRDRWPKKPCEPILGSPVFDSFWLS